MFEQSIMTKYNFSHTVRRNIVNFTPSSRSYRIELEKGTIDELCALHAEIYDSY